MGADQVLPVDASARPKQDAFAALAREALAPHKGRAWRLFFEPFRGVWNTVSREEALALCKEVLSEDNQSVTEPEITILCTLSPRFVGLAIVDLDVEDFQVPFLSESER